MLVLNTNQGSGGAYELSNKSIVPMYPECDGNILIYPELARYDSDGTLPTAFSINGTPVHALSGVYEMPYNNHINMPTIANSSSQVSKPPISYLLSTSTSSRIFRVGIETPLQEGLTIGKQIIFPTLYQYAGNNGTYYSTFQVKVGLLHTDGTITYVATNDYSNSRNYFSYVYNIQTYREVIETYGTGYMYFGAVTTGSGMTTVEGDRIIVEYVIANSSELYTRLILGTQTPITEQEKIRPIQISVD